MLLAGGLWNAAVPLQLTAAEAQGHDEWYTPYYDGEYHTFEAGFQDNRFSHFTWMPGYDNATRQNVVGGHIPLDEIVGSIYYEVAICWIAVQTPDDLAAQGHVYTWRPAAIWIDNSGQELIPVKVVPVAARLQDEMGDVLFRVPLRLTGDVNYLGEAIEGFNVLNTGRPMSYEEDTFTYENGGSLA